MKTKTRFAWKQFLKNLAIIAIPVALQNMLTTTGSMIDTMMIAPLGETTYIRRLCDFCAGNRDEALYG